MYRWVPILGRFQLEGETLIFKGGQTALEDGRPLYNVGNFVCDQHFGGGSISAQVQFDDPLEIEACELILYYHPPTQAFITAGLGGAGLCAVRSFTGQWRTFGSVGDRTQLRPGVSYDLLISARGSQVSIRLDGVNVLTANLPIPLPRGQAGVWCMGARDIRISNFTVTREKPKAFVVMQFTPPYNELYTDVIRPVCDELGLQAVRTDETFGPGLIIADIARQIVESNVVIADITPANPNVYYEVGHAHALGKPTILIAEKPTQLPFDVSPFRTLFYENTIGGKARVEAGLRKHLEAIQTQWGAS